MGKLSYIERAKRAKHPVLKKCLDIMESKKTNLALSADVTTAAELLQLADTLGPKICVLKTHIDVISDFTPALTTKLRQLANLHNFLLFEDRKFADIGNTVAMQFRDGIYQIAKWADLINAHVLPGPGIIEGLQSASIPHQHALLLLAQMSSTENLFSESYIQRCLQMAIAHANFVVGFIAQKRLLPEPDFLYLTPGVKLQPDRDQLGQVYTTPQQVIIENQCDIIIVGRGIITAADPLAEANQYRNQGWQAYLQTL